MRSKSNYGIFCYGVGNRLMWFRVLGYGLHISDKNVNLPLFSERNGLVKVYRIGNWGFKFLVR